MPAIHIIPDLRLGFMCITLLALLIVMEIFNAIQMAGFHTFSFNTTSLPPGNYVCSIKINDVKKSIQLLVM